ncbi:MAG: hypothetical protein OXU69_11065, partial [Gemmatimonadota bacterium]|nr:hypothetical protein [Gemmatimonadota bacterium]
MTIMPAFIRPHSLAAPSLRRAPDLCHVRISPPIPLPTTLPPTQQRPFSRTDGTLSPAGWVPGARRLQSRNSVCARNARGSAGLRK